MLVSASVDGIYCNTFSLAFKPDQAFHGNTSMYESIYTLYRMLRCNASKKQFFKAEHLFLDIFLFYGSIYLTSPSGLCGNTCTLEGDLFIRSNDMADKAFKQLNNR